MIRRKYLQSRGQALLEFAITIPLLLLMLVFLFDLGRVVFYTTALNNAARVGARFGIINQDSGLIQTKVEEAAFGINPADMTITATGVDLDGDFEDDVIEVAITYEFVPATPIIANFLGNGVTIPLDTQATMQLE